MPGGDVGRAARRQTTCCAKVRRVWLAAVVMPKPCSRCESSGNFGERPETSGNFGERPGTSGNFGERPETSGGSCPSMAACRTVPRQRPSLNRLNCVLRNLAVGNFQKLRGAPGNFRGQLSIHGSGPLELTRLNRVLPSVAGGRCTARSRGRRSTRSRRASSR